MSKVEDTLEWLKAYADGYELEQSKDKFNWYPLNTPPTVGDDFFYRKKESNVIPIHQSDDPLPNGVT